MNTTNVTNAEMSKKAASMKAVDTLIKAHPVEMVATPDVETPVTVTQSKKKYQKKPQPTNVVTSETTETSETSPPPKRKYERKPKVTTTSDPVPDAGSATEAPASDAAPPKKKYQRKPKVTAVPAEPTTTDPLPDAGSAADAAPPKKKYQRKPKVTAVPAESTTSDPVPDAGSAVEAPAADAAPPKKKYYRKPKLTNTVIAADAATADSTLTNSVSVTNAPDPSPCATTTAPELVSEEIFAPPQQDVGKCFESIHDIHTIQTFLLYLIEIQMIPLDSVPSILNTLLLKTKLSIIDTEFPTPITKHLIISELHTHLPNVPLEHPAHEVVYNGRLMLLNHLNQMFDACDRSFYAYM
jgi:hypothetical protein